MGSSHAKEVALFMPLQSCAKDTQDLIPSDCRGMQCTSYVKLAPGVSVDDLRTHLKQQYANEFFVKVGSPLNHHSLDQEYLPCHRKSLRLSLSLVFPSSSRFHNPSLKLLPDPGP